MQVLKYEPGQFYRTHHDQNAEPDTLMGVRLFTFFIYLQTPEGGGGTRFPHLDLTISPTKGTALLWPNVLDSDLRKPDMRTNHEVSRRFHTSPVVDGTRTPTGRFWRVQTMNACQDSG